MPLYSCILFYSGLLCVFHYQNNPDRSWCSPSVRPLAVMLFLFCCILETEAVSHSWSVWTELFNYATMYVAHFLSTSLTLFYRFFGGFQSIIWHFLISVDNSDGSLLKNICLCSQKHRLVNRVLYLSEPVCNFSELSDISLLFPKLDAAMIKYLIVLCPRTVYDGVLIEQ